MKTMMLIVLTLSFTVFAREEVSRSRRFNEKKVISHIKEDKKLNLDVLTKEEKKEELLRRIFNRSRK